MSSDSDLRSRILSTARQLLDEGGVSALSLREVARRAGVTHQAPYHHFGDRESIVAELVTAGFAALAGRLAAVNDAATTTTAAQTLAHSGLAYVEFALDEPGVFRVMFRPELCDPARFPHAQDAGARAHAELQRMVRLVHGQDDEARAVACWSMVHGLACLLVDGPLGLACPDAIARRALAAQALEMLTPAMLAHGAESTSAQNTLMPLKPSRSSGPKAKSTPSKGE